MPKVNYNLEDEAISQSCSYCGKTFYHLKDESFCNSVCEVYFKDYIDWYDDLLLDDFLKQEEGE